MLFKLACKRYRSISSNARETEVTRAESDFLTAHEAKCIGCRNYRTELDMMTKAITASLVDPFDISRDFTDRVVVGVKKMRRESYRTSYRPVLVGAVAAFVAVGAILQTVGLQPAEPTTDGTAESTTPLRETPLDTAEPGNMNLFDTPSKLVRDPRPTDV
jgi:hypothetical protein